jgi:hypothetical protein
MLQENFYTLITNNINHTEQTQNMRRRNPSQRLNIQRLRQFFRRQEPNERQEPISIRRLRQLVRPDEIITPRPNEIIIPRLPEIPRPDIVRPNMIRLNQI